jgi:hypothetical protein
MGDRELVPPGQLQVNVHIAARVNHGRVARSSVTNQIRQVGQTVGTHRLEDDLVGRLGPRVARFRDRVRVGQLSQHHAPQAGTHCPLQKATT